MAAASGNILRRARCMWTSKLYGAEPGDSPTTKLRMGPCHPQSLRGSPAGEAAANARPARANWPSRLARWHGRAQHALVLDPPPNYLAALGCAAQVELRPERSHYDVVQLLVTSEPQLSARLEIGWPWMKPG